MEIQSGSGLKKRLADIGVVPGARLKLISANTAGPVIISIKGARIAIGKGVAQRIMVIENGGVWEN